MTDTTELDRLKALADQLANPTMHVRHVDRGNWDFAEAAMDEDAAREAMSKASAGLSSLIARIERFERFQEWIEEASSSDEMVKDISLYCNLTYDEIRAVLGQVKEKINEH